MNGYERRRYKADRYKTIRSKTQAAYKVLRKAGYVCRSNFWCCQGCGGSVLATDYDDPDKYIFWHQQDTESAENGGELYLAWDGNGWEIAYALREQGLTIHWDGTSANRIAVGLPEDAENSEAVAV